MRYQLYVAIARSVAIAIGASYTSHMHFADSACVTCIV